MKKLILLSAILLTSSCSFFADEGLKTETSLIIEGQMEGGENDKDEPKSSYPVNYKTFYLSVDNQIVLLNKLLEKNNGKNEVVRYFLALRKHDSKKAFDLLGKSGNEALRFVILENLPEKVFTELLTALFDEIGGEAVAHWGYKSERKSESMHMLPCVRAQQYVNFFMEYDTLSAKKYDGFIDELKERGAKAMTGDEKVMVDNQEALKARGEKMAQILNQIDSDKVMEILYGRPDTRLTRPKDRIVPGNGEMPIIINRVQYDYQRYEIKKNDRDWRKADDKLEWLSMNEETYKRDTSESRVFSKWINFIVPYLKTNLIVSIFEKETNGNQDALVNLVKSMGCKKAFNELFEYLEDAIKDKVFESCSNDSSLFEMLFGSDDNVLALGSGQESEVLPSQDQEKDL